MPAAAENAVTTTAGIRCQVTICKGSSIAQLMRISAKEQHRGRTDQTPAPAPRIGAPHLTATKAPPTAAPRACKSQARSPSPTCKNSPSGSATRAGRQPSPARTLSSTRTTATATSRGAMGRPGIAVRRHHRHSTAAPRKVQSKGVVGSPSFGA